MYLYLYFHLYKGYYLPWVLEVFLACGGNFRCWPKAEATSGLTETGNRARKVSGTQGSYYSVKEHLFVCSSFSVSIIACVAGGFFICCSKSKRLSSAKAEPRAKKKMMREGERGEPSPLSPSPIVLLGNAHILRGSLSIKLSTTALSICVTYSHLISQNLTVLSKWPLATCDLNMDKRFPLQPQWKLVFIWIIRTFRIHKNKTWKGNKLYTKMMCKWIEPFIDNYGAEITPQVIIILLVLFSNSAPSKCFRSSRQDNPAADSKGI